MVLCPVCNKENKDEEYCTDCGTKLLDVKKDSIFEFDENRDISNVNELNIYLKELNEKIYQQKKFLDELSNDPLVKEYGTISKINDENNELRTRIEQLELDKKRISSDLKGQIEQLELDKKRISSDLKRQKKLNSQLRSEMDGLRNKGTVAGVINSILGSNNNRSDANFCPNCGYKLS